MKLSNYIIIFLALVSYSCEETTEKRIKGITSLNQEWTKDNTTYWQENLKDSTWSEIEQIDTLKYTDYSIRQTFDFKINENLKIKKLVLTDKVSKIKTSETDIYSNKINFNVKSELSIGYEFLSQKYSIYIYDSIGTDEKIELNQAKLDSIYEYVELNNLELCGTAANEILWKDIPEFPIPRIIELDSALKIIEKWRAK